LRSVLLFYCSLRNRCQVVRLPTLFPCVPWSQHNFYYWLPKDPRRLAANIMYLKPSFILCATLLTQAAAANRSLSFLRSLYSVTRTTHHQEPVGYHSVQPHAIMHHHVFSDTLVSPLPFSSTPASRTRLSIPPCRFHCPPAL